MRRVFAVVLLLAGAAWAGNEYQRFTLYKSEDVGGEVRVRALHDAESGVEFICVSQRYDNISCFATGRNE